MVYVVVTVAVTRLVPESGVAPAIGAVFVALGVQPARAWLEARVHRLVYGAAASPDHVVSTLGSHLRLAETADDLLRGLAADVGSAMRLESVSVHVPGRDAVVWGMPHGHPVEVPLGHRGEHVGDLVVTLPGGESLGARGDQTLTDLATVVATAVAVTRAAEEVEKTRDRLARARLEERRVIRREIHDGLGPSLAGLRLGLQGARNLLATDPVAAAELLSTLQAELDQRVSDVRSLSHSLLPPVLDELGLSAALAELAAKHAEDGLEVGLDLRHDDVLGPAGGGGGLRHRGRGGRQRRAPQRCAARAPCRPRAPPTGCTSPSTTTGGASTRRARPGVGSRAMRERAEEQGGRVDVRSGPGRGTTVEACCRRGRDACLTRSASPSSTTTRCSGSAWPGCSTRCPASPSSARPPTPPRRWRCRCDAVDVILMDLHLGEDSGIETTRELVRRDPGVRVLVVTMREDDDSVVACMRVGRPGLPPQGRDTRRGRARRAGRRERRGSSSARPSRPGPSPP